MRDLVLFAHIILGGLLIIFPIIIVLFLKKNSFLVKSLSVITAFTSWILLIPAGKLYITFYPATKTLIKAGALPWAHSIVMETKEHWGLLLPITATVAAGLVLSGKADKSKQWWIIVAVVSILLAIMGRIVKMGAFS